MVLTYDVTKDFEPEEAENRMFIREWFTIIGRLMVISLILFVSLMFDDKIAVSVSYLIFAILTLIATFTMIVFYKRLHNANETVEI